MNDLPALPRQTVYRPGVYFPVVILGLSLLTFGGFWLWRGGRSTPADNAILVIAPYRQHDTWVFDDPEAGLRREPFVAGVPEMIDSLVAGIPNADGGFRLLFSAQPFPDYQRQLDWVREEKGGNWYRQADPPLEGWICPALFKYYTSPPASLYVKAEPLSAPVR